MDRSYSSGAVATPPAAPASPSVGYPTAGSPAAGTAPTKPGPYWYHMITEELLQVVLSAGITPAAGSLNQLSQAISQLISNSATPVGSVVFVAKNAVPAGFIKANGAAISRIAYAVLFAYIGTTYGAGDGSTTFNVPDLRGEFLRGWDDSRGVDLSRVFGSFQTDEIKSHTHPMSLRNTGIQATGAGGSGYLVDNAGSNTNATGGTETRPRNVALLACIKY